MYLNVDTSHVHYNVSLCTSKRECTRQVFTKLYDILSACLKVYLNASKYMKIFWTQESQCLVNVHFIVDVVEKNHCPSQVAPISFSCKHTSNYCHACVQGSALSLSEMPTEINQPGETSGKFKWVKNYSLRPIMYCQNMSYTLGLRECILIHNYTQADRCLSSSLSWPFRNKTWIA